ncbi:MAG TPA: FtsX-like permease family protein, partial [Polyangia bacterium]|nr:FtsX-like permease family protein [Polyangia bacterium]
ISDFGVAPGNIANVMVPFAFADELRPVPVISWPPILPDAGWRAIAESPSGFAEYWVRLPTAEARTRFAAAVAAVDPRLSLRSGDEIALRFNKAPAPYRVFLILTLVVLEVSVINLMRMLLAKATSRAAEIGIHRALGAGRNTIFARQLMEGVLVSMTGSVLGLILAVPTVAMFDRLIPDTPILLAVTPTIVATVLLVCLLAALVSGIYPAWRVASVAPTRYLGKI